MVTAAQESLSQSSKDRALVLWFDKVGIADIPPVGGKNASLGEMIQQLAPRGVSVPNGFGTTAHAYRYFIQASGLEEKLRALFSPRCDRCQQFTATRQASPVINSPHAFPAELTDAIATLTRSCVAMEPIRM